MTKNKTHIAVLIAFLILLYCLCFSKREEEVYVREPDVFMKPVVVEPEPTIEDKIKEYFPKNWKIMIAVAHAESGMDNDAIGYNCMYDGVSKACKKEDRHKAWSVDCFALQKNYPGRKTCPEGVTIDMHLREVAELSKKQGLTAWSAYKNGAYLQYLASN